MAIGLSMPGGGVLSWFGDKVAALVNRDAHAKLEQSGAAALAIMRVNAPVDTGNLRAKEDYRVEGSELIFTFGAEYDILTEHGTRFMAPHPHIRIGLNVIPRIWGSSITLDFNAPYIVSPVLHHKGDFIIPSGIQARPLTAKQKHHVQHVLRPSAKGLHRGNVKRAKIRVRRHG